MNEASENVIRPAVAEFIGTFMLVFAGTGAIVSDSLSNGSLGHIGISLVFGLVIMVCVYAFGHISGAHFNPAVTFGFTLSGKFPLKKLYFYWLAQFSGAISASFIVKSFIGAAGGLGVTKPISSIVSAIVIETVLTALLMLVIMAVATDTRAVKKAAAIAIGGTITLASLCAGPLTGASLNPARSLGPALIANDFSFIYIYFIGPLAGAAIGSLTYMWLGKFRIK